MRLRTLIGLSTLTLAAGCSATGDLVPIDGIGPHEAVDFPIINGLPPDAPEHDAVVALHELAGNSVYVSPFCSGTLIAPDVVLTAAHCLDVASGGGTFQTIAPGDLAIYIGDEPAVDILDHLYFVTETLIHPDYDRIGLYNDAAILRLASDATEAAPVPNLPASLGFTQADVGSTVNFAGFGDDENDISGVRLQVDGTVGSLGCYVAGCPDVGDTPTMVAYEQDYTTGGPCFGDSGGPMFVDRGGDVYVGGMTSYGDDNCAIYGVSTRADAFETWIDAFVTATPPPPPVCDFTGTLSSSNKNDTYSVGTQATGTLLDSTLSWDNASADLDLQLRYKLSGRWKTAVKSETRAPGVDEVITYTVPSSLGGLEFQWKVKRRSGTATYCLAANGPPPANTPPTADAGGPYGGEEGTSISFDGSGSSDSDGSIVDYTWDFGDGGTGAGASPLHTYSTAGSYVVTLTVTDDDGDQDSATTTATVVVPPPNVAPNADAGGPYSGEEGTLISFDGSGSSDSDGSIADYDWDFGDGGTGTGVSPSHAYAAAGTYIVTLTVTDDDGDWDTDTASTTVTLPPPNQLPNADAGGPYSGTEGNAVAFDGSGSSDPDGSIVSYDWDFGDGNTGTGVNPSNTYAAAGTYAVTVTVTDDDGDWDSAGTTVTVSAAPACLLAGTVSSSNRDDYLDLGALGAGTLVTGSLTWDDLSADLDLELQWFQTSRSRWKRAAKSGVKAAGVFESLSYVVPGSQGGADFRWKVKRRSGTTAYCLTP